MSLETRVIRIRLRPEVFRKYKVFCAISDISLTDQTNKIIGEFVEKTEKEIKIIKVND